jgi:hypothetical protein
VDIETAVGERNRVVDAEISVWGSENTKVICAGTTGVSIEVNDTSGGARWHMHYMPDGEASLKDARKRAEYVNRFALGMGGVLAWVNSGELNRRWWGVPEELEIVTNETMAQCVEEMFAGLSRRADGKEGKKNPVTVKVNLQGVLNNNLILRKIERMGQRVNR